MQNLQNRIIYLFSIFVTQIKGHKSMGNTDINRVAEDILIPVFKEVYDYRNLKNLNHHKKNYPAIDLGDETAKISIQVTATSDSGKIQETLRGFIKNEYHLTYERVQVYILTEKEEYKCSEKTFRDITNGKIQFDKNQDILDCRDLLEKISKFKVGQLQRICDILEANFGEGTKLNTSFGIYLPLKGVAKLAGRKEELIRLRDQLQNNNWIAIVGMPGVGKTELALQYAKAQFKKRTYPGRICWLQARDQEIATQIVKFAEVHCRLTIPAEFKDDAHAQVRFCYQYWPEGDVLIVLDDVTNYEVLDSCLPYSDPRFKLLITTQFKLGSSFTEFPLKELKEDGAIDLLKSLVKDERIQVQLKEARALCRWVENLPLALELLGRFLARKPDWTVARLLQALDDKRLDAEAMISTETGMTGQLGVAAALELSWQELSETEQELACVLGMFAIAPIPWQLVERCLPEVDTDDLEDTRDNGLLARSLLKRVGEGS
jgi:DNA polymerase III delta prime subunit